MCWVVRSVTHAPALMAAAATASIASAKRCSLGAASMRVVPTREYRRPRPVAYLSRSSSAASARIRVSGLVSEAWASSSIMVASVSGRPSAASPAQVTRPGSAGRIVAREVVVAVVVVVDHSPAECVVSCARVVVGAVGTFCGKPPFEGFAHRFGQERTGNGVRHHESARVECGDAWRHPVARGKEAELLVGEAYWRGGVRAGWVWVCCEESASGASEGIGADCFSQGRGRGGCRHCLPFHSTYL